MARAGGIWEPKEVSTVKLFKGAFVKSVPADKAGCAVPKKSCVQKGCPFRVKDAEWAGEVERALHIESEDRGGGGCSAYEERGKVRIHAACRGTSFWRGVGVLVVANVNDPPEVHGKTVIEQNT